MNNNLNYVSEFVRINGIDEYMFHIKASEESKEVMIFLHGGPGSSEATSGHYVEQFHHDMFHIVYYDQRGAGKTYMRDKEQVPDMSMLLEDLHQTVEYVKEKYQKDKVILFAHSFGTVVAALYVKRHPENVLCYIGAGQMVEVASYAKARCEYLLNLLKEQGKSKQALFIQKLGEQTNQTYSEEQLSKLQMIRLRIIQIRNHMLQGPGIGMKQIVRSSPIYEKSDDKVMMKARKSNYKLIDYCKAFRLADEIKQWPVPTCFISGDLDFQVPYSVVQQYVADIKDNNVQFHLINQSGHFALIDNGFSFWNIVREFLEQVVNKDI